MNLSIFRVTVFAVLAITTQTASAYPYTVQLGCVYKVEGAQTNHEILWSEYVAVKAEFRSGHYVLDKGSIYEDAVKLCAKRSEASFIGLQARATGYVFNGASYPVMPPESLDDFVIIDYSLIQPLTSVQRTDYVRLLEQASMPVDYKTYEQITKDVVRSHTSRPAFFGNSDMAKSLTRVLFTFNHKYQKSGYSQGYNDIAAQLFIRVFDTFHKSKARNEDLKFTGELEDAQAHWIFNAYSHQLSDEQVIDAMSFHEKMELEANVFASLERVMGPYLKATNAGRNSEHVRLVNELVTRVLEKSDPELFRHLNQILGGRIDIGTLLTGWNIYFLAREIPSEALSHLWNTYLTDEATGGFALLHPFVSATLIMFMKDKFMALNPEDNTAFATLIELFGKPIEGLTVEGIKNAIAQAKRIRAANADFVASYAQRLGVRVDALQEGVLDNGHVTVHHPIIIVDNYL